MEKVLPQMRLKKFWLLCLKALLPALLAAQTDTVLISLYNNSDIQQVFMAPHEGDYLLVLNTSDTIVIKTGTWFRVSKTQGAFRLQTQEKDLGLHQKISVLPTSSQSLLKILPETPKKREQWYEGSLEIRYRLQGLKLINRLSLEAYTAGVVQAESGVEQNEEYYKVQGIICRTFAISNTDKHAAEGFNLCDQTHCQVYHGKPRVASYIFPAMAATQGLVLVDKDLKLVEAVFHSNCGGQTLNSEDYWRGSISYLRSKLDSLCENMPHWSWTFTLNSKQWLGYLEQKFNFPASDSVHAYNAKNWNPDYRGKWFMNRAFHIPTRTIREDWRLRSTNFSIVEKGENVVFLGNGFGHGVGLCQEGAMARSRENERFSDILHFYYRDVYIVDKAKVPYYRTVK